MCNHVWRQVDCEQKGFIYIDSFICRVCGKRRVKYSLSSCGNYTLFLIIASLGLLALWVVLFLL